MEIKQDILYFDGRCPLCSAEIDRLRRWSDQGLSTVNVHDLDLEAHEKEMRLKVLHLERADGTLLKGLDANVAAWQYTRLGFLTRWLRWPLIGNIADAAYAFWAERRYKKLYSSCEPCSQQDA